jgi:hypothetical protein
LPSELRPQQPIFTQQKFSASDFIYETQLFNAGDYCGVVSCRLVTNLYQPTGLFIVDDIAYQIDQQIIDYSDVINAINTKQTNIKLSANEG